ncbi:hypothetical protein [Aureimonas mangrovi]|uniref:hypothetical protein n=1 Tax=Aureimonas mangrovi TaxID=2758041 RepID=UPI00163D4479|nr:hypothetical protein [Aureimonas mangrovi]
MSDHKPVDPAKLARQQRLEQTLRENLKRRRTQAKARREDVDLADKTDEPQTRDEQGRDA